MNGHHAPMRFSRQAMARRGLLGSDAAEARRRKRRRRVRRHVHRDGTRSDALPRSGSSRQHSRGRMGASRAPSSRGGSRKGRRRAQKHGSDGGDSGASTRAARERGALTPHAARNKGEEAARAARAAVAPSPIPPELLEGRAWPPSNRVDSDGLRRPPSLGALSDASSVATRSTTSWVTCSSDEGDAVDDAEEEEPERARRARLLDGYDATTDTAVPRGTAARRAALREYHDKASALIASIEQRARQRRAGAVGHGGHAKAHAAKKEIMRAAHLHIAHAQRQHRAASVGSVVRRVMPQLRAAALDTPTASVAASHEPVDVDVDAVPHAPHVPVAVPHWQRVLDKTVLQAATGGDPKSRAKAEAAHAAVQPTLQAAAALREEVMQQHETEKRAYLRDVTRIRHKGAFAVDRTTIEKRSVLRERRRTAALSNELSVLAAKDNPQGVTPAAALAAKAAVSIAVQAAQARTVDTGPSPAERREVLEALPASSLVEHRNRRRLLEEEQQRRAHAASAAPPPPPARQRQFSSSSFLPPVPVARGASHASRVSAADGATTTAAAAAAGGSRRVTRAALGLHAGAGRRGTTRLPHMSPVAAARRRSIDVLRGALRTPDELKMVFERDRREHHAESFAERLEELVQKQGSRISSVASFGLVSVRPQHLRKHQLQQRDMEAEAKRQWVVRQSKV